MRYVPPNFVLREVIRDIAAYVPPNFGKNEEGGDFTAFSSLYQPSASIHAKMSWPPHAPENPPHKMWLQLG